MSAAAEVVTTKTNMAALKPTSEAQLPSVNVGFHSLQAFELVQRVAKMFSSSTIVPDTFKGNIGNCCIALEMSERMGASPLMVMQNLYIVYGRPAWSAKFLIACFNQCGRFEAISYEFSGTPGKDDWSCVALSKELATGKPIRGPKVSIKMAKDEGWYDKKGSKWQTIPELMLRYRSGSWLVNTTAPEISMGLNTDDEISDTFDARRGANGEFAVDLESLRTPAGAGAKPEPKYTNADACIKLRQSGDAATLSSFWNEIVADYDATDREIPNEVHAAYNETRETLNKL